MKKLTSLLARVSAVRLPSWSPQDARKRRLKMMDDMAQYRSRHRVLAFKIFLLHCFSVDSFAVDLHCSSQMNMWSSYYN